MHFCIEKIIKKTFFLSLWTWNTISLCFFCSVVSSRDVARILALGEFTKGGSGGGANSPPKANILKDTL